MMTASVWWLVDLKMESGNLKIGVIQSATQWSEESPDWLGYWVLSIGDGKGRLLGFWVVGDLFMRLDVRNS